MLEFTNHISAKKYLKELENLLINQIPPSHIKYCTSNSQL